MRKFGVVAVATLCAALLAGCETIETLDLSKVGSDLSNFGSRVAGGFGSGLGVDKASKVEPRGSEFSKQLYSGYLDLARDEFAEGDYGDSDRFADYAIKVAAGANQEPEEVSSRKIPESAVGDLTTSRARLMRSLAGGARTKAPAQAAKAQVMFDCWMQEQEENRQPDDISRCRDGFNAAIGKLEPAMAALPEPKPVRFVVYFDNNKADLTDEAQAVIAEARAAARKAAGGIIKISGSADSVGPGAYNQMLSEMRVDAVAKVLAADQLPVKAVLTEAHGEAQPAVFTADGVPEARNRRVDIVIEP